MASEGVVRVWPKGRCLRIVNTSHHFHEIMGGQTSRNLRPGGTVPSHAIIATEDRAVGTANEVFMAQRAQAHITEVDRASHLVMLSHSDEVAKVIEAAATRNV